MDICVAPNGQTVEKNAVQVRLLLPGVLSFRNHTSFYVCVGIVLVGVCCDVLIRVVGPDIVFVMQSGRAEAVIGCGLGCLAGGTPGLSLV